MTLESVTRFVFDNIGSQLSTTKIANTMTSAGRKIDPKTVGKYLKALLDGMMIYQAKRYNIKGKQYLKTLEKYYVVDILKLSGYKNNAYSRLFVKQRRLKQKSHKKTDGARANLPDMSSVFLLLNDNVNKGFC